MVQFYPESNVLHGVSIQDNFLEEKEFIALRDVIQCSPFLWYFSPMITSRDKKTTPGMFYHEAYTTNVPCSPIYNSHLLSILEQLNMAVLISIRINLNLRLLEPWLYSFHTDIEDLEDEFLEKKWTTSIFYMNTNNGWTELEDGTKVESVANRLFSFPANIKHRGGTQTDEQTRILINFNYLKYGVNKDAH